MERKAHPQERDKCETASLRETKKRKREADKGAPPFVTGGYTLHKLLGGGAACDVFEASQDTKTSDASKDAKLVDTPEHTKTAAIECRYVVKVPRQRWDDGFDKDPRWDEEEVLADLDNEIKIRDLLDHSVSVQNCPYLLRRCGQVQVHGDEEPGPAADGVRFLSGPGIVCERAKGSVQDEIDRRRRSKRGFSAKQIQQIAHHVSCALEVLHDAGVAHNDVDPRNVLVFCEAKYPIGDRGAMSSKMDKRAASRKVYKLGDFGAAACIGPKRSFEPCAVAKHPFEGSSRTPYDGDKCSATSDAWGLGVTLLELLDGNRLGTHETKEQVVNDIDNKRQAVQMRRIAKARGVEKKRLQTLLQLATALVHKEPGQRATVGQARSELAKLA